ncbi:glycosyltransferase family 4 protein [Rhodovibrionaceae bacterium A322]
MHLALVTDAWYPQINGVVRTLARIKQELESLGLQVTIISPQDFKTIPCPTYPEIRLALAPGRMVRKRLRALSPDAIHIATEGPLGWAARGYCLKHNFPFTTSYHTRFPEYVSARIPVPSSWGYRVMRWFHGPSKGVMVATKSLRKDLESKGFSNIVDWTRGVDTELFHPRQESVLDLPRPIYLYVGRVSVEKNIGAFLDLELEKGTKVVVGDGPQLSELKKTYPDVVFTGAKEGEELSRHFASGDIFVFPSKTDTFGLVLLEAMASGLPVAAYPVTGPLDVVDGFGVGALDNDLAYAIKRAIVIPKERCRAHAMTYSWEACAQQFLGNLAPRTAES